MVIIALLTVSFGIAYNITTCTGHLYGSLGHDTIPCDEDWYLMNNITCVGFEYTTCTGAPMPGVFTGTFYGNNYTITNFTSNGGLIGEMEDGVIKDLRLIDFNITGTTNVGLVKDSSNGTIDNVQVTGTITGTDYVGGLVGSASNNISINNSYVTGTVTGTSSVGGLVGYISDGSVIDYSYFTGNVTGETDVGGLVGYSFKGTIDNSYSTSNVTGYNKVGGLMGNSRSSIIYNSHVTGNISAGNGQVGGLVGSLDSSSTVNNSYAIVTINGDGTGIGIGGLIGVCSGGLVYNSYAIGTATATGTGDNEIGGLIGKVDSSSIINKSYSTVTTIGNGRYVGGLIGSTYDATIDNSYSTGTTIGTDSVGGLMGLNSYYSTVDNSFATGNVTGTTKVGGLIGYNYNYATVDNSYWHDASDSDDATTCVGDGSACSGNAAGEPLSYFQGDVNLSAGPFDAWDFATPIWYKWTNPNDYPKLEAQPAASGGEATAPNITDNNGNSFNMTDDQDSEISGTISEDKNITIKDSTGTKLVEVEGQFSNGNVDLSNLVIKYDSQRVVVDFSSVSTNIGATHTLYYPNDGVGFTLCPEAKTLSQAVPGCLNETLFTHYDATNNLTKSVAGVYDVTATIDGNYYKISGLTGTAITWAKNVSIITRVSISNTPPIVDSVTLSDSDGGDMDLYPNASVTINCSGTASDTDGWSTITVNATLNSTVAAGSTNNLLNHYSNTSCVTTQNTATVADYFCTFSVWYNAVPGTWTCTVTSDDASTTASNTDEETMGQLMAIDVDSGDLDFGSMAIGESTTDTSLDHSDNKSIYNQGNVIFDVNLKAYGDSGIGDNHSMSCDAGNITISMLRYTFNTTAEAHNWTIMTPIVNGSGTDYNISIPVSADTSGIPANPYNDTWWTYKIPTSPIVSGDCSGTLIFSAISDT